ncbi:MAG: lytic transglycosylase domain-containing protein [Pseudomonadota bacterium]
MVRFSPTSILAGLVLMVVSQGVVFSNDSPVSADVVDLAQRCAPGVDPMTIAYMVAHESGNRQFAVNVNRDGAQLASQPTSAKEALAATERLDDEGHNYDLGLAQINSANFEWLGVTAEDMIDPCKNLSASERVISDCYSRARNRTSDEQSALRMALSCYNTGSMERGFANGYVDRVEWIASQDSEVPRLIAAGEGSPTKRQATQDVSNPEGENPSTQSGQPDAFGEAKTDAFSGAGEDAFATSEQADDTNSGSVR